MDRRWTTRPREQFIAELAPLDPVRWLPKLKGPLLMQFADNDEHVSAERRERLVAAAPKGADVRVYKSGHELNEEATRDRLAWLRAALLGASRHCQNCCRLRALEIRRAPAATCLALSLENEGNKRWRAQNCHDCQNYQADPTSDSDDCAHPLSGRTYGSERSHGDRARARHRERAAKASIRNFGNSAIAVLAIAPG